MKLLELFVIYLHRRRCERCSLRRDKEGTKMSSNDEIGSGGIDRRNENNWWNPVTIPPSGRDHFYEMFLRQKEIEARRAYLPTLTACQRAAR